MRVIYNNIIPTKGFKAINIFGVLFVRRGVPMTLRELYHEKIHTAQIKEMFYVFFYLWYVIEWLVKLPKYGRKAYENISFEREAYGNQKLYDWVSRRKPFHWMQYLRKC